MNTLRVLKHSMVQRYSKSQHDTHKASPSHSHLNTSVYTRKKNLTPSPLPFPPSLTYLPAPAPQIGRKQRTPWRGANAQLQRRKPPRKKNLNRYGSTISITVLKVTKRKQETGKHHRNQPLSRVLAVPLFLRNPLTHTERPIDQAAHLTNPSIPIPQLINLTLQPLHIA